MAQFTSYQMLGFIYQNMVLLLLSCFLRMSWILWSGCENNECLPRGEAEHFTQGCVLKDDDDIHMTVPFTKADWKNFCLQFVHFLNDMHIKAVTFCWIVICDKLLVHSLNLGRDKLVFRRCHKMMSTINKNAAHQFRNMKKLSTQHNIWSWLKKKKKHK